MAMSAGTSASNPPRNVAFSSGRQLRRREKVRYTSTEESDDSIVDDVEEPFPERATGESEEEEDDELEILVFNQALAAADGVANMHITDGTRRNYLRTVKFIAKQLKGLAGGATAVDSDGYLIVPLQSKLLRAFFGKMTSTKQANGSYRTVATLSGYLNALKHYYDKVKCVKFLPEDERYLATLMEGYKKKAAECKKNGQRFNEENGRNATSIVRYLHKAVQGVSVRCCAPRFSWEGDCLVVDFTKHKGDQCGEKLTPKHVFANPFQPSICPVLALALHVFSVAFRESGSTEDERNLLFAGRPYDMFGSWLEQAIKNIQQLGQDASQLGSHSFRKGVACYVASFLGGPSVVTIFLRAGWSLGQVQKRYLTRADGSDNLCGRVACGLSLNDGENFAVLPPAFDSTFPSSDELWREIAPGYDSFPRSFQGCLPYLVASIVYHYDWIVAKNDIGVNVNVPESHPIFLSRLFMSGKVRDFRSHLLPLNTSGRCPSTSMTATGIAPSIDNVRHLAKLERENQLLREEVARLRHDMIEIVPKEVVNHLLENIAMQGVHQMPRSELIKLIESTVTKTLADGMRLIAPAAVPEAQASSGTVHSYPEGQLMTWKWNGLNVWYWNKLATRPVPFTFRFPRKNCAVKNACDIFMFGIPGENIRPFRHIKSRDLQRDDHLPFRKARQVFQTVIEFALHFESDLFNTKSEEEVFKLPPSSWDRLFEKAFLKLVETIRDVRKKRLSKPGYIVYQTIYDILQKKDPPLIVK